MEQILDRVQFKIEFMSCATQSASQKQYLNNLIDFCRCTPFKLTFPRPRLIREIPGSF